MFKGVIFDLDGTLLDTLQDLAESMNAVLCKMGFPTHETEKYKYFVGDGTEMLVKRALPQQYINTRVKAKCVAMMKEEYSNRMTYKTKPYDGIAELLDELTKRRIKMAILSNKPDKLTRLVVRSLLPDWEFAPVLGQRDGIPKKPHPCGAFEIAKKIGIKPENFLFVGDTNVDMRTSNAAGMCAVGVLWGFRDEAELMESGARAIIKKPVDLLRLLEYENMFCQKSYSNNCIPSFS
ncbi:MAG: HAD family hydrolase [Thermoanaerobacterales bacterium]|jgi:phosphoglycolate phosphatase|nr:HAD family hydrolase [Thermoanaerobacterales bacterium]